jgi:hypothetical protein
LQKAPALPSLPGKHFVAHAVPHAPQLSFASPFVSQPGASALQSRKPALQTTPHCPPEHVAASLSPAGQSADDEHS